jgi:hypothetical protein
MYETKVARPEHKVAGVKTRWERSPSGAWYGFDDDDVHVTGGGHLLPGPAGPSWDDRPSSPPDRAGLERAKRAGMAAMAEGFGGVLPDGAAPCGTCVPCQVGRPAECRRPVGRAEALLRAGLAHDADRIRAEALAAELAMLHVELSAGLA